MKKSAVLVGAVVFAAAGALFSPTAQAGAFGNLGDIALKMRGAMQETIPTESVSIEAMGANMRAYVFDAPFNPAYACIFAAGEGKGGLTCYPKANPTQKITK